MDNVTNEDFVEGIAVGDEFHDLLQSMNSQFGRGEVVSLTWRQEEAGSDKYCTTGMVVCRLQYGMCARAFRVLYAKDGFTLFYAGRQKTVKSDYFIPF